jgi:uncharacterized phosphosugar-binding protein
MAKKWSKKGEKIEKKEEKKEKKGGQKKENRVKKEGLMPVFGVGKGYLALYER